MATVHGIKRSWVESILPYDADRQPLAGNRELSDNEFDIEIREDECTLMGMIKLPGIGKETFFADDNGGTFAAGRTIDFVAAAAATRLREVKDLAADLDSIPVKTAERIAKAESMADGLDRLIELYHAGEELVQAEAQQRIAAGVDGPFGIGVCLKGFTLGGQEWRERMARFCRTATIPLTWGILEPEREEPHFDVIDEMIDWCRQNKMAIRGHALIWHSGWEKAAWMGELAPDEVKNALVQRARALFTRYPNTFDMVELINEPIQSGGSNRFSVEQVIEQTVAVYEVCKELSPKTKIMISFYSEDERWYAERAGLTSTDAEIITIRDFIGRCRAQGVGVDLLGFQLHVPTGTFYTRQVIRQWHREFGLPIHITEITVPSSSDPAPVTRHYRPGIHRDGWRGKPWTEALQAQWQRTFLPMYYAQPGVEAAIYWGNWDAPKLWADYLLSHSNELYRLPWMAYQGLLREDLSPKPAYDAIVEMADSWGISPTQRD